MKREIDYALIMFKIIFLSKYICDYKMQNAKSEWHVGNVTLEMQKLEYLCNNHQQRENKIQSLQEIE